MYNILYICTYDYMNKKKCKYIYIYIYIYIYVYFILLRLNLFDAMADREGWWFEHSVS